MIRLHQLKRRLAAMGVELLQTKHAVRCPDGETRRFYYFEYDGKVASLPYAREDALLSYAEVARIERRLGLPMPI